MSNVAATAAADLRRVNGMYLEAKLGTYKGDQMIQSARVYIEDANINGGLRYIGMIQLGREDGSAWMISLNSGWLPDVEPTDIYSALDKLAELRTEADITEAQFRTIMRAVNEAPADLARNARHDLRSLVNAISRNTVSSHGVRHAASQLAADVLF